MRTRALVSCAVSAWLAFPTCSAGETILDAAREGDLAGVRRMLAEDPTQVSATSDSEKTPLHYAAQGGHLEVVELLVAKGAKVGAANVAGETPLHYAAAMGHNEVVRVLVAHGAELAATSIDKNTPLHYTAFGGKADTAKLLLELGADVNATNHYGYTALDLADTNQQKEVCQLLRSAGGHLILIQDPEVLHLSGRLHRIRFPFGDVSNIAVSSGDDGVLLVDTGFSPRAVERLERALHDLGGRQVRYIINTHLHPDHIAGNRIGNDGATIIDQSNLAQRVSEGVLSLGGEPIPGRTGRAFDTYYALAFNGEEVRLIPYPGIHTDNDLIVHFTRSGVVHMGDLLISQSFPSITRKVDEYLELLERALDVFPETTTFVCGHGREMTPTDVREYHDMLVGAAAIVRRHMQEGKERREVREIGALAELAKWGDFIPILNADYWIDAVYNSAAEGS